MAALAHAAASSDAPKLASDAARAFSATLCADILPFWLEKGWDKRRGGFHERFFFDKTPDSLMVRRVRTQFRQINALAGAARLGCTEGLRLAFRGLEFLVERAWSPDGAPGFVHVLAPDGTPTELARNISDHASAIEALATLAEATGDAQVSGLLRLVMNYTESAFHDAQGWLMADTGSEQPLYRVNAYMHLFEAMVAAQEMLAPPHALARATRIRRQLESTLIDIESGFLPEYLTPARKPLFENESFRVSPGDMAQWAAALRRYEHVAGTASGPRATHLLGAGLRAAAPATGFLLEAVDSAGTVHDSHTRLWAQCALAQAWLGQARIGIEGAQETADATLEKIAARFLKGPFQGAWIDRLSAQGQNAIDTVPASTLDFLVKTALQATNPA